jgi:hypothetical protein
MTVVGSNFSQKAILSLTFDILAITEVDEVAFVLFNDAIFNEFTTCFFELTCSSLVDIQHQLCHISKVLPFFWFVLSFFFLFVHFVLEPDLSYRGK